MTDERCINYQDSGIWVTPETAFDLDQDQILFGNAYLKSDGTRLPAWEKHGFKEDPTVKVRSKGTADPS